MILGPPSPLITRVLELYRIREMVEGETDFLPGTGYVKRLRSGYLELLVRNQALDWILKVQSLRYIVHNSAKEHPKFKRKGAGLFVEHTLSLTDALCGFQFVLTHLDTRNLLIKSNRGEVRFIQGNK